LSAEKKLEILEVLHGEIKSFSPEKKEQMHQIVKEEINRDGKFDFKEFVIYAYLRPALKNIKISTTHLSKSEFEKYGNYVLTFLFKMDENELTKEMSDKLSNYFPFKPIDTKLIKYSTMLKVFEKIRFTNIDQKEKLILACKELIDHNGHQSEKELIILRLIKQMISVPGIA